MISFPDGRGGSGRADDLSTFALRLRETLGDSDFDKWFRSAEILIRNEHGTGEIEPHPLELLVRTRDRFQSDVLRKRFSESLLDLARAQFGGEILLAIEPANKASESEAASHDETEAPIDLFEDFHGFVATTPHRLLVAAAAEVVADAGSRHNPLVIRGHNGSGKSRFLRALADAYDSRGGKRVEFVSAHQFASAYSAALVERGLPSFHRRFREADVLIVDDIEHFASLKLAQAQFSATFDELVAQGRQIVVSVHGHESYGFGALDSGLRSRLQSGVVLEILAPDIAARREILRREAERLQISVHESELDALARSPMSLAEALGHLKRWLAESRSRQARRSSHEALGRQLSSPDLTNHAGRDATGEGRALPSLDDIVAAAARYFDLTPKTILGVRKERTAARARHVAIFLARELTGRSLPEIGRYFGGRHHSTIAYAVERVSRDLAQDDELGRAVGQLRDGLARG